MLSGEKFFQEWRVLELNQQETGRSCLHRLSPVKKAPEGSGAWADKR